METKAFRRIVYAYYRRHRRPMPWRETRDPYRIVVSEVMLQQTQVSRVREKYPPFIAAFPDVYSLAKAPLGDILRVWQGLGYNRRALYLKKLAQAVVGEYGGVFPRDRESLRGLPGIGPATSASICAFAFGIPCPFIETNIRSVFIHHFFGDKDTVSDSRILPLVAETLDFRNPRDWYYALMDYGVFLKEKHGNPSRRSAGYKKQPPLEGSIRQARATMIRYLLDRRTCGVKELTRLFSGQARARLAFDSLVKDGLVSFKRGVASVR